MCGVAGCVALNGERVSRKAVREMVGGVRHRGPDGEGLFSSDDGRVCLGHTRLAILDLEETGSQPMQRGGDRGAAITYNGEIYNYRELRASLEEVGRSFRGSSDTEVILEGYLEWGASVVHKLRGMFAFVLYDKSDDSLVIVRDRLGIKPLYVYLGDGSLWFCSELDPLRNAAHEQRLDRAAIAQYLRYSFVPGPASVWQGIEKVPAGALWKVDISGQKVERERYWTIPSPQSRSRSETDAGWSSCSELVADLEQVLSYHSRSDVPIGLALSGGLDSSTCAALLTGLFPEMELHSFSVGFGTAKSELALAEAIAERYGTRHHTITLESPSLDSTLDRIARVFGEPLADSSAIATYRLFREISRYVKVVISGDGGDELFGGYRWYPAWYVMRHMPRVQLPSDWSGFASQFGRWGDRFAGLVEAVAVDGQDRYDILRGRVFSDEQVSTLLPGTPALRAEGFPLVGKGHERMRIYDLSSYTKDSILAKVDRTSMAHGLEVRVPFLDHVLVEKSLGLRRKDLMRGRRTKVLLRRCMKDRLPQEIVEAPKSGFGLPLRQWGPEIEELARSELLGGELVYRDVIAEDGIRSILENSSWRRPVKLWTLLVLERWLAARPGVS